MLEGDLEGSAARLCYSAFCGPCGLMIFRVCSRFSCRNLVAQTGQFLPTKPEA